MSHPRLAEVEREDAAQLRQWLEHADAMLRGAAKYLRFYAQFKDCQHPETALIKEIEQAVYPELTAYRMSEGVDCESDIEWQQFVYEYAQSHGPALSEAAQREYERWART